MNAAFWKGFAAYLIPTFPLGYFWHLTTFAQAYQRLGMLRPDPVIPLGLSTMIIQAGLFSWAYPRLFDTGRGAWVHSGLKAALGFGLLSWSFSTLAVAAKYQSNSTLDFIWLETAFTTIQFLVTGLLIALAYRSSDRP